MIVVQVRGEPHAAVAAPDDHVLTLKGRGGQPIQSTKAKQLAQYVVLYSPIHMAADLPEHYARHMDGFQFIKDVPTDWQDTRVVNGEVGDYVTIARKDRNSEDWYLGSVTDENAPAQIGHNAICMTGAHCWTAAGAPALDSADDGMKNTGTIANSGYMKYGMCSPHDGTTS